MSDDGWGGQEDSTTTAEVGVGGDGSDPQEGGAWSEVRRKRRRKCFNCREGHKVSQIFITFPLPSHLH